jgi:S1-C subfamily serine protease
MGSPLGKTFAGTLTRGVVSGVRQIGGKNFIQSDARILPGSSGGPLLDARSRVIGMAVSGVNAGAAGINLFIPIQEALQVLAIEIE